MNELQIRAAAGLAMKLSLIAEEEIATPAEIVDALCPLLWDEEGAGEIKMRILSKFCFCDKTGT